jgi:hypothetical protein
MTDEKVRRLGDVAKQFEVWSAFNTPQVSASEARRHGDLAPGQSRIIRPDREALEDRKAMMQAHGFCRHFRLEDGQKQIEYERLWERLIYEEKYDIEWFSAHFKGYGLCDVFEGLAVNAMSPGKVPGRFLDSTCPFALRDKSVTCPFWEDRKVRGEKIVAGHSMKRSEVY